MRIKIIAIAAVAVLGLGATIHHSGDRPMCPLGKMLFSGKASNTPKKAALAEVVKPAKSEDRVAAYKK